MPTWTADAYRTALRFTAERHNTQPFKGAEANGAKLPYLLHITTVCGELQAALQRETVASPDLAVQCALLHDVLEDTSTTREELAATFGEAVATGVEALTKRTEAAPDKMGDSLRRIRLQPPEIWMVKLADRITNLYRPPPWTAAKRVGYRDEAEVILEALGPASPGLAERLRAAIAAYPTD